MPDLKLRMDDVGRGFVYRPTLGTHFVVPDPATGRRVTERLTPRAARQIKGAALKAALNGTPLRTFMTFTMDMASREAVESGEVVIGREMRRTLNALGESRKRKGEERMVYVWVAENPGGNNPHVHLLTDHTVRRSEFLRFAGHVESLWGHGWVKVQRIRRPERAGAYILKAVGYSLKGQEGSQGPVAGNRYGVARAILPRYETLSIYDCEAAGNAIGALQAEMTEDVEMIGPLALTHYGLSFPAGSSVEDVMLTVCELNSLGQAVHMSD